MLTTDALEAVRSFPQTADKRKAMGAGVISLQAAPFPMLSQP
ncbi:hypothetical protein [Pantoea vagans]|nr:hypothetical protein [Pantoea vagans]